MMSQPLPETLKSVAILSTSSKGGAGAAAYRFADALREDDAMRVDFLDVDRLGEQLPRQIAPDWSVSNRTISDTHYTVEHPGFVRGWLLSMLRQYDLVNIHWAATMISTAELEALSRTGQPLLFTLHDFHYLTGGCHYPASCSGVASGCRACPQIDAERNSLSLPVEALRLKKLLMSRPNVHVAAPSQYLADRAVISGLTPARRAHCVRNPYQPVLSAAPQRSDDAQRIVLIADSFAERRKNMAMALDALQHLAQLNTKKTFVVDVIGAGAEAFDDRVGALGLPVMRHGHITEHEEIAKIFAGADMLLSCSLEDNWPNILVEGGAYHCAPIVGPGHGCEEFVRTYGFGSIAEAYTPESFAQAMLCEAQKGPEHTYARAVSEVRKDHDPKGAAQRLQEVWRAIGETCAPAQTALPTSA